MIKKFGNLILIFPEEKTWEIFQQSLECFSEDFLSERAEDIPQKRKSL